MTITADQAKTLLDNAEIEGVTVAAASLAGEPLPEVTDCGDGSTIADTSTPAVAELMAAAPDLARTVIDQASMIGKLFTALRQRDQLIENYRAEWGDL